MRKNVALINMEMIYINQNVMRGLSMRRSRRACLAALATGFVASLHAPAPAQERPLLIFAAASLKGPLDAAAAEWTVRGGKAVAISYAASNALARQLEQGAPADLFISADLDWMDWAQERALIRPQSRVNLLGNDLVLVAPLDSAARLTLEKGAPLAAAIGDSKLATGQIDSVPVGRYAKQALTWLGAWDQVAPKIAGAESARAALALVARGEAAFGVVYGSDAKAEPKVKLVARFPEESHPPIVYPGAVTAASPAPDAAKDLLRALASPAGRAAFEAAGFKAPPL
jgi:molybdate transport system substrate-binding protein